MITPVSCHTETTEQQEIRDTSHVDSCNFLREKKNDVLANFSFIGSGSILVEVGVLLLLPNSKNLTRIETHEVRFQRTRYHAKKIE